MAQKSETLADQAVQSFILKMCAKLEGIFDSRDDLTSASLRFIFANGDQFCVSNDIIINVSILHKPYQFPT